MHYVIGDLHSNHEELSKLLNILKPKKQDTLIFLGDILDKGKDARLTLEKIWEIWKEFNCVFIMGDHEYVWYDYLENGNKEREEFILKYGGKETLDDYSIPSSEIGNMAKIKVALKDYLKLIKIMKPYLVLSEFILLHAGLLESQFDSKKIDFEEYNFFIRPEKIKKRKYLDRYRLISGHTFLGEEPSISKESVIIDTGAGYKRYLSAYIIEEKKVVRSDGSVFLDEF
jgi:serine/threonine protein phosphatase 1